MANYKFTFKQAATFIFVLVGLLSLSSCLKNRDSKLDEFGEYFQNHINDRWRISYEDGANDADSNQQWYIVFNRNANDYQYTFADQPVSDQCDLVMKAMSTYDPYSGLFFINTLENREDETLRQSVYQINLNQDDILLVERKYDSDFWGPQIRLTRESIKEPFALEGSWLVGKDTDSKKLVEFKPNHELVISSLANEQEPNQQTKGYTWKKQTAVLEIYDTPNIALDSPVIDYYIAKEWTDSQIIFQSYKGQITLEKMREEPNEEDESH